MLDWLSVLVSSFLLLYFWRSCDAHFSAFVVLRFHYNCQSKLILIAAAWFLKECYKKPKYQRKELFYFGYHLLSWLEMYWSLLWREKENGSKQLECQIEHKNTDESRGPFLPFYIHQNIICIRFFVKCAWIHVFHSFYAFVSIIWYLCGQ